MNRRLLTVAAVALAVLAVGGLAVLWLAGDDDPPPETIEVVVPAGTGELGSGTSAAELLPRRLEVSVGDTLVIDNRDDVTHAVGPYVVAGGQRLEHRFTERGVIEGECTLHPSGQVTIVVN